METVRTALYQDPNIDSILLLLSQGLDRLHHWVANNIHRCIPYGHRGNTGKLFVQFAMLTKIIAAGLLIPLVVPTVRLLASHSDSQYQDLIEAHNYLVYECWPLLTGQSLDMWSLLTILSGVLIGIVEVRRTWQLARLVYRLLLVLVTASLVVSGYIDMHSRRIRAIYSTRKIK